MKQIRLFVAVGVLAFLAIEYYENFLVIKPAGENTPSKANLLSDTASPGSKPKTQVADPTSSNLLLSNRYIDVNLLDRQPYQETPYPKSFSKDGYCIDTHSVVAQYNDPPDAEFFAKLAVYYPDLERNPGDLTALSKCLSICDHGTVMARSVPFFERFVHAGGDPRSYFASCEIYLRGLTRLGRMKEALERYEARWGKLKSDEYGIIYSEGFTVAWIVQRDIVEMKRIFQIVAENDLVSEHAIYYMQEVFSENFKRANAQDMQWFLKYFADGWVYFTPVQAGQMINAITSVGAKPPQELLDARDELFNGRDVPAPLMRKRAVSLLDACASEKALILSERALQLAKDLDERFNALILIARVLRYREELERAFDVTREASRVAEQMNSPLYKANSLQITAYLYEHLADPKTAIQYYDRMINDEQLNNISGLAEVVRQKKARCMVELGEALEVEPELREWAQGARNISLKAANHIEWGMCLLKLERFDDAISAFEVARAEIARVGERFKIEISLQVNMELGTGRAYLGLKRFSLAERYFRRAETLSRGSQPETAWWRWQLGLALAELGDENRVVARRLLDDCIATIESQRASLKDFLHRRTINDNKYEAFSLAVGLALDENRYDDAFDLAERSRARAFLDELGAHAGQTKTAAPVVLKDLIQNTGEATLISFYLLPDRLAAWIISDGKSEFVPLEITEKKLQELVRDFYLSLQDDDKKGIAAAQSLHHEIWAPLEAKLRPGRRVIVIPHGILQSVPFQALHDGNAFLVEKREICVVPSASAWMALKHRTRQYASTLKVFDAILSKAPPFDKTETLELRRKFPDAEFFLPPNATLENFNAKAREAGVLHLSCHGSFNTWLPLESGLLLNAGAHDDGRLRARDVYGMHFNKTRLVVMSACLSSVGELAGGDEVTGLARAFQVAGVNNVIGALWPVENEATTELMQMFYDEYERADHDPVTALIAAQRRYIARDPRIFKWAGFQVIGDGAQP